MKLTVTISVKDYYLMCAALSDYYYMKAMKIGNSTNPDYLHYYAQYKFYNEQMKSL